MFTQLVVVIITAACVLGVALAFIWLFDEGQSWLEGAHSQNPLMSPILWFVVLLVGVISLFSRIWRKYQEKQFIKKLQQQRKSKR
ncbi:hypothetical protein DS2_04545 [Catenovulum agarivorans DS-2]|uniref:Uncharacterized protein n=1 Tax=Catenovulum agarivorans DS-2 TaxID=1328313 RepID=W7QEU4_9ALTE|nr:hypothetical protein [Catenovulum agarivorans]EWH11414.1 hypothetical protein DS2_04545 [Catenovulum agarivorans DS-2]